MWCVMFIKSELGGIGKDFPPSRAGSVDGWIVTNQHTMTSGVGKYKQALET